MPNHSNKLQNWISKSEQDRIESLIAKIESQYPFEVVVAFSDAAAVVPIAAARMIALLAIAAGLVAEIFWIPVPAWAFGLAVFLFLLAPVGNWQGAWLFRLLSRRSERQQSVQFQAEQCFSDLGHARTKERNALLLFFNLREHIFILKPDRTLDTEWPELKIEELATELKANLDRSKTPETAAAQSVERLLTLAAAHWPDAELKKNTDNQLSNALTWWSPR